MAVCNEVNYSKAKQEERFGAEFWMPDYLEPLKKDRNWHLIGDLLTEVQYGISREMNEENIGVPIFRMNEMDDLFLSTPRKYVQVNQKEYGLWRLSPGDVLFNRTNSYKFVGRTGILTEPGDAVFASYLIRLVPDQNRLLPEYLTVYLNTPTGISQVKRRAMESINQANVSGSEIKKVSIPLFSLSFQRQIAKLVAKASKKRIEAREMYASAGSLLLSELRIGELDLSPTLFCERPFSETQQAARLDAEYFSPRVQRIIAHLSEDDLTISDVAKLTKRHFKPKSGVPFHYMEIADIGTSGSANSKEVAGEEAPSRATWIVKPGDVITTTVRPIRRLSAIVSENQMDFVCSSGFAVLKAQSISSELLLVYLRLPIIAELLDLHTTASMYPSISNGNLLNIPFKMPRGNIEEEIVNMIQKSFRARDESHNLLEESKQMVEDAVHRGEC